MKTLTQSLLVLSLISWILILPKLQAEVFQIFSDSSDLDNIQVRNNAVFYEDPEILFPEPDTGWTLVSGESTTGSPVAVRLFDQDTSRVYLSFAPPEGGSNFSDPFQFNMTAYIEAPSDLEDNTRDIHLRMAAQGGNLASHGSQGSVGVNLGLLEANDEVPFDVSVIVNSTDSDFSYTSPSGTQTLESQAYSVFINGAYAYTETFLHESTSIGRIGIVTGDLAAHVTHGFQMSDLFVLTEDDIEVLGDPPTLWAGYSVNSGWINTGNFMGDLYVENDPWIYSDRLDGYIFLPEANVAEGGSWTFFLRD